MLWPSVALTLGYDNKYVCTLFHTGTQASTSWVIYRSLHTVQNKNHEQYKFEYYSHWRCMVVNARQCMWNHNKKDMGFHAEYHVICHIISQ